MNRLSLHCPIAHEDSFWSPLSCCIVLLIYFRVGKVPLVGIGALIYGGLSLIVSCGEFSKNGTQDVLKGRNGLLQILNLSFFTPCQSGVRPLVFFFALIF